MGVTQEHLRIFTYVLLGMLLGIIVVALFMDVSKSSKPASQEQQVEAKESKTDESNSTGAE